MLNDVFFNFLSEIPSFAALAALSIAAAAFTSNIPKLDVRYSIFSKISNDFIIAFFFFVADIIVLFFYSLFPQFDILGLAIIFSLFIGLAFLGGAAVQLLRVKTPKEPTLEEFAESVQRKKA
jgi:hypothetical protein